MIEERRFIRVVYLALFAFQQKMATSMIRQNFHQETEAGINKQINLELYSSYVCLSMVREER